MIRAFATSLILLLSFTLFSQTLDEVKALAGKNQWEKARDGIEQFLSKESNKRNPEAWQLKSLIV